MVTKFLLWMDYCALRRNSSLLRPKMAWKKVEIVRFSFITKIIQRKELFAKVFTKNFPDFAGAKDRRRF
jgi:hypothetical protein